MSISSSASKAGVSAFHHTGIRRSERHSLVSLLLMIGPQIETLSGVVLPRRSSKMVGSEGIAPSFHGCKPSVLLLN